MLVESVLLRQPRVHSQSLRIGTPRVKVLVFAFDSRVHSCVVDACVSNIEITLEESFLGIWNKLQQFCEGSGNFSLNIVRNSLSSLQYHFTFFPNEREGMSEMEFSGPGMCIGINGEARAAFNRTDSTLSIAAAVLECLEFIRRSQDTVGELSFRRATCRSCRVGNTCSITSHSNSPPAHSKSEFVILPFGFDSEISKA